MAEAGIIFALFNTYGDTCSTSRTYDIKEVAV